MSLLTIFLLQMQGKKAFSHYDWVLNTERRATERRKKLLQPHKLVLFSRATTVQIRPIFFVIYVYESILVRSWSGAYSNSPLLARCTSVLWSFCCLFCIRWLLRRWFTIRFAIDHNVRSSYLNISVRFVYKTSTRVLCASHLLSHRIALAFILNVH